MFDTNYDSHLDATMEKVILTADPHIKVVEYVIDFVTYDLDLNLCLN